jgi:hypothetical protein
MPVARLSWRGYPATKGLYYVLAYLITYLKTYFIVGPEMDATFKAGF